jgi:hypothetical protein
MKTKFIALMFLVSTAVAVASVANLQASREYSTVLAYYSDSSLTEQVGEGFIDCQWHFTLMWGSTSDFYTESNDPCGNGGFGCWPECTGGWVCYAGACIP